MIEFGTLKGRGVNWFLLLLAFVLALGLWVYVTVQDNPVIEQRYDVPVDYINLPDNLAISDKTETVRLRVSAPANVLNGITASDINAYVDLSGAVQGRYAAKLQFELPESIQLVSADRSEVSVLIDALRTAQRSVNVVYTGNAPDEDYMALAESIMPGEVVLSGAEDKLALAANVYVTVDLTGLRENFRSILPVNVTDADGNSLLSWLTPEPAMVDVLVPVVGSLPTKAAPVSVTLSGAPAEGYVISRIIIDPAVATVFGPQSLLDTVDYIYTSAVNISGAAANISQSVSLLNVDGLTVDKNANCQVQVIIEREAVRTIDDVAIAAVNQQVDCSYQLAENTCSVTVRGPASVVNMLTNTDIEARVDVSSLGMGSHRLPVRVSTSFNATVEVSSPAVVPVTVSRR